MHLPEGQPLTPQSSLPTGPDWAFPWVCFPQNSHFHINTPGPEKGPRSVYSVGRDGIDNGGILVHAHIAPHVEVRAIYGKKSRGKTQA